MQETKTYSTTYTSPIGVYTLTSDGEALTGIWMVDQKYYLYGLGKDIVEKADLPIFDAVKDWLDRYFAGKNPPITGLRLAPDGGEFKQMVWDILCKIPYGTTTTYGQIAKEIALKKGQKSMSSQAVGGAVGHNPISIIIPCHRVVGSDGSLTGYAGGLPTKIKLLELEGAALQL